jgi:hypothetical protein
MVEMFILTEPVVHFSKYGSIVVNGSELHCDIIIHADGKVEKSENVLCGATKQTPCIISKDCLKEILLNDIEWLIIGTGHHCRCRLSDDAAALFEQIDCKVCILPTHEAAKIWNNCQGSAIGLFHVTY